MRDTEAIWIPASQQRYRKGRLSEPIWIVLHCTQGPIVHGAARGVGGWWSKPPNRSKGESGTSAHYTCDHEETVCSVDEADTAWAAGKRGNRLGIHIELVGIYPKTDWLSGDGLRVFERARALALRISDRTGIPWVAVHDDGLIAGLSGLTTHASISAAFKESSHVDPGGPGDKRWPWERWLYGQDIYEGL